MHAGLGVELEHGVVVTDQSEFEHPHERPHVASPVGHDLEPHVGELRHDRVGQGLGSSLDERDHEIHRRWDQCDPFGERGPELGVEGVDDHQDASGAARAHRADVRLREERLAGEPVARPGQQGMAGGLLVGDVEVGWGLRGRTSCWRGDRRPAQPSAASRPPRCRSDSWTRRNGAVTFRCLASSSCAARIAAICSVSIRFCARSRSFSSRSARIKGSSSGRASLGRSQASPECPRGQGIDVASPGRPTSRTRAFGSRRGSLCTIGRSVRVRLRRPPEAGTPP